MQGRVNARGLVHAWVKLRATARDGERERFGNNHLIVKEVYIVEFTSRQGACKSIPRSSTKVQPYTWFLTLPEAIFLFFGPEKHYPIDGIINEVLLDKGSAYYMADCQDLFSCSSLKTNYHYVLHYPKINQTGLEKICLWTKFHPPTCSWLYQAPFSYLSQKIKLPW